MPRKSDPREYVLEDDPLWYKDAIIYELHVRAFADSDGDGIGDFRGAIEKLDYLQDLGVSAVWLLPFYPSPLRDDGYDIAEYTQIHPDYGTLADFRQFVREAHKRGLRVITELVINHTSDQHPWFQRARKASDGSRWRDFYVWSDTPDKYRDTRIIFKDFETSNWSWDPVAKAYYWHRFYSHQPDLNFDNPEVHRSVIRVLDKWMQYGVDGFRLDAIPYLYEREGTNCENLPETHQFLRKLRTHIDKSFRNRMILAEANQWPEDAAAYFGKGDQCHMNFHFPLMPRMFMAVRSEDRSPILDILEQTPTIADNCQWATFLRNHDELTLEMVTDEERDYMYRVYASDPRMRINLGIRRRLAPLMGNNRRTIELMNSLLFSVTGTPVLYYGDELGMGDNIYLGDRNSVRTPMQWSADRNAGFSQANPQQLYLPVIIDPEYHYESVNVEAQQKNPSSLLWWMKRLIAIRRQYKAFGRGSLRFLYPENRKVLAFLREYEDEHVLVVANLSRFSQFVELDLSDYRGMVPMEIFGHNEFPVVEQGLYRLSLAPHTFFWFDLTPAAAGQAPISVTTDESEAALSVRGSWDRILAPRTRARFLKILPDYLQRCRWFGGKGRRVTSVDIISTLPLEDDEFEAQIALIQVLYTEGEPEVYHLPLTFQAGDKAEHLLENLPAQAVVARMKVDGEPGVLYDAGFSPDFVAAMLKKIVRRRSAADRNGLVGQCSGDVRALMRSSEEIHSTVLRAEQSNTSMIINERFILKLFRRVYEGTNPDLEIGRFLTEHAAFGSIPAVHGSLELARPRSEPMTLAVLQEFVHNDGDAWSFTLDHLRHYDADVLAHLGNGQAGVELSLFSDIAETDLPHAMVEALGTYPVFARRIGFRTAEMHVALASDPDEPAFAPEPFTPFYRRSLYQSMRNGMKRGFTMLRRAANKLPEPAATLAQEVLSKESDVDDLYRQVTEEPIDSNRIRIHGDFHLGQVLSTGADVVILDFEGEPARTITERRLKRSPLQDVAGMLRSFQYAAYTVLLEESRMRVAGPERLQTLGWWVDRWQAAVSSFFLQEYRKTVGESDLLPSERELMDGLLRAYMLDKAMYEVQYELNNRPDWVEIPLAAILQLVEDAD